jgi:hypothetical protein
MMSGQWKTPLLEDVCTQGEAWLKHPVTVPQVDLCGLCDFIN